MDRDDIVCEDAQDRERVEAWCSAHPDVIYAHVENRAVSVHRKGRPIHVVARNAGLLAALDEAYALGG